MDTAIALQKLLCVKLQENYSICNFSYGFGSNRRLLNKIRACIIIQIIKAAKYLKFIEIFQHIEFP